VAELRSHARHDRFAISGALAGGTLPGTVTSCPACGALHSDLLTIRDAIRRAWLPTRPRDLRLTATTAAGLRPSGWRRLVQATGSSRDALARSLALSLVGLGFAGLLLTGLPAANVPFGSAGAVPPGSRATEGLAAPTGTVGIAGRPIAPSTGDVDRELAMTTAASREGRMLVLSAILLASGGMLLIVRRLATGSGARP
jgi:hypothetical protein